MWYNHIMKKLIFFILLIPSLVFAGHIHPEKYYQNSWCIEQGGQAEYRLPDMTRCDCLTDTHAVEVDFARKWHEALGQSLYYAMQTGKRAGIVLIVETEKDLKYWIRLNSTIQHFDLPVDTWQIKPG